MAEDIIIPRRISLACLLFWTTTEDTSIKRKLEKTNQKVPTSKIVPKKDQFTAGEKILERRNATTIPKPDNKHRDFGKLIFPSKNLAIIQKIIETASPTTKNKLFEISTGIFVNGKKKAGNNIITKKRKANEILLKIFDIISCCHYTIISYKQANKKNLNYNIK
ncbi:MAG: hypothetical protein Q8O46_04055 [bacterium]|nr:hypothetical protein [bacterium]